MKLQPGYNPNFLGLFCLIVQQAKHSGLVLPSSPGSWDYHAPIRLQAQVAGLLLATSRAFWA